VAAARAGRRTLLVSTDPAPSVGDALRQPLTASVRKVAGTSGRLDALEVDAVKSLDRWLRPRRSVLETIALRGTWLDRQDVSSLLSLSLPGIDEIAALLEINRFGRLGRYDLIVVDTAPTGHTLRMLRMPELLGAIAGVFDRMQDKHRAIVEALRGKWTPEASDALIESLYQEGRELAALLRDRQRTSIAWVTLPEPMAVAETLDALEELRRLDLAVGGVVVNRVTPAPVGRCRWCEARRRFERHALEPLMRLSSGVNVVATVATRRKEPRGTAALAGIGRELEVPVRFPRSIARVPSSTGVVAASVRGKSAALPVSDRLSLLMFGGKGGVGKTTCAAAAAISAAAAQPDRPVLLLSSDPAHSLADVLGVPLDDEPRPVAGAPANLRARELDALARFAVARSRYSEAIDTLFDRIAARSALEASTDRRIMRDLLELAPPGLDELVAIVEVGDALEAAAGRNTLVVLDTAPTGHALRLLEMPAIVHDWIKTLMAIVLKYQPVVGAGEFGELLLQMSQGLRRLRARLVDPALTTFVTVTRPAALPAAETGRLRRRLRALRIHAPCVLVNAIGAGTCRACVETSAEQRRALAALRKSSRMLIVAPALVPPPHGAEALVNWRRSWRQDH
jgi:arsenite-transporting ATPase